MSAEGSWGKAQSAEHHQRHQRHRRRDTTKAGQLQDIWQIRRDEHRRNRNIRPEDGPPQHGGRVRALRRRRLRARREAHIKLADQPHLLRPVPEKQRGIYQKIDKLHGQTQQPHTNPQRRHLHFNLLKPHQQHEKLPRISHALHLGNHLHPRPRWIISCLIAEHQQPVRTNGERQPNRRFTFQKKGTFLIICTCSSSACRFTCLLTGGCLGLVTWLGTSLRLRCFCCGQGRLQQRLSRSCCFWVTCWGWCCCPRLAKGSPLVCSFPPLIPSPLWAVLKTADCVSPNSFCYSASQQQAVYWHTCSHCPNSIRQSWYQTAFSALPPSPPGWWYYCPIWPNWADDGWLSLCSCPP